jgi:3'-phosphoadenosine 5'-phosphosulfate sulfotransferase (PAPS reductase)/FAD synthetase
VEPIFNQTEATRVAMRLRDQGALFVVSHSGGKDSQAMLARVRSMVPDDQIFVVHADLGEVEWPGTLEHARATSKGLVFEVCRAGKTLLGMVEKRGMFPSPKYRQCTSDLKRGPITKTIRAYADSKGLSTIIDCWGLRAEESPGRKSKPVFTEHKEEYGKRGRAWYIWLPIHELTTAQVFDTIRKAGQEPHWAYAKGSSRLSCSFCIMANKSDLAIAARERPELFKKYVDLEKKIGHTVFTRQRQGKVEPVPLEQFIGVSVEKPRRGALPMLPAPSSDPLLAALQAAVRRIR